jgi:hypothetical protein
MTSELALLSGAESALATASTIPELKSFRDEVTAAKAWAKSRGLGIESENKAAEYILRAERKIGAELIRMSEVGERATSKDSLVPGGIAGTTSGPGTPIVVAKSRNDDDGVLTLSDLGVSNKDAFNWQRVARLTDEQFERMIAQALELRERIAKINFYRVPEDPTEAEPETKEDPFFLAFRKGAEGLLQNDGVRLLPDDELRLLATLIQRLVAEYQSVKAARHG